MVRKNTKNVNRPDRKLQLTPAAQAAAQRMSAVWATDMERPGKGGGRDFPGFGK